MAGAVEGLFRVLGVAVDGAIKSDREELFTVALVVMLLARLPAELLAKYLLRLCAMLCDTHNWAAQLSAGKILRQLPTETLQAHCKHLLVAARTAANSSDWRVQQGALDILHQVRPAEFGHRLVDLAHTCPLCGCCVRNGIHNEPNYKICDVCFNVIDNKSSIAECEPCGFICCAACCP